MTTDEVVGDAEVGESIARQAGRGLKWSLLGTLLTKIGSFAMGLVLARLLAPEDFGQYAIALAALGVLMHINDLGLIAATVQWRGKLEEMAPTAAVLAAGFGIAIYGVFWLAAPAFAAAAGDSGAAPVVRILTLIIVIDGLTAVRSGALMRNFQQKELIIANGLGFVVNAALSIYLAAKGNGAYSFAWGQLAGAFATGVLVCVLARVPLRISVDRAIAKRLMHFGVPLAASLGVDAVITNVQLMIVGHLTGPTALGYFLLAFNISSWAQTILGTAIRYVSVAGFSRLSEHDDEALSAGVRASMSVLVTVVAPIVALMSALATPLVVFLYGHSWSPAAPVLRILVVLTLARMMTRLAMDVLMGAGATRAALWFNVGWAIALAPTLWFATQFHGLQGAAMAQAGVGFFVAIPLAAVALRRVRVGVAPIGRAIIRPLFVALVAAVIAFLLARFTGPYPVVQLLVAGTAGVVVYLPLAVPREQLSRWRDLAGRRGGKPEPAAALN
ncbi:polysaccharide transporter, PST family [Micromonospora rhizosphaerae]|uniref:Polysaccharide transporter, PST family n=1 Tax=Micromonospora rhizosphaerae TaxID=568872 RepID=A0A1C6SXU0_9ACTN|nr:oligosaccharide flippase family protein [Micromonospora rhizosphaerae]SCL34179.1 polysaccharide transporter, PST family [Micromonospora rhizosphaerae]